MMEITAEIRALIDKAAGRCGAGLGRVHRPGRTAYSL